jgi:hypothetical protein
MFWFRREDATPWIPLNQSRTCWDGSEFMAKTRREQVPLVRVLLWEFEG